MHDTIVTSDLEADGAPNGSAQLNGNTSANGAEQVNGKASVKHSKETVNRNRFAKGHELQHSLHGGYSHLLSRDWHAKRPLTKSALMIPLFISDNDTTDQPVASLPNDRVRGVPQTVAYVGELVKKGLRSVIVFGIMAEKAKDYRGSAADDPNGPVIRTIKALRKDYSSLFIAADVCLCEYTSHGHCGLLREDGSLNNGLSIDRISDVAVAYAEAGADCVAPSDMNDNRIRAIKLGLEEVGLVHQTVVMSYSAKFTSCLYGPFRVLADSNPKFGDRGKYQLPPAAGGLGRRAMERDVAQGADIIMVKPGALYLDVVRDTAAACPDHPVAVFHVSGEAAMIHAGVKAGLFNLKDIVMESTQAMHRAGATIVITYFTPELLEWLDG